MRSLCETCRFLREVRTPRGSRFLLCRLSQTDARFAKYPPQPVLRCGGYQPKDGAGEKGDSSRQEGSGG
jgi:hypothetical protein